MPDLSMPEKMIDEFSNFEAYRLQQQNICEHSEIVPDGSMLSMESRSDLLVHQTKAIDFYVEREVVLNEEVAYSSAFDQAQGDLLECGQRSQVTKGCSCYSDDACYNKYLNDDVTIKHGISPNFQGFSSSVDERWDENIIPKLKDPYESDSEEEGEFILHSNGRGSADNSSEGTTLYDEHNNGVLEEDNIHWGARPTKYCKSRKQFFSHDTSTDTNIGSESELSEEIDSHRVKYNEFSSDRIPQISTPSTFTVEEIERSKSPLGIAAYIDDNDGSSTISNPISTGRKQGTMKTPKKPHVPWYCVSRPIHEQTRDLKISSINKSSSIHLSRLLQKCRSIIEFCTVNNGAEEITEDNITTMNHNHHWGDSLPTSVKGNTIRIVFQNVNHSVSASDNPHTTTLLNNLHCMEADVFMAAETNVNWKSAEHRNKFVQKLSRAWPASRVAFSSSDIGAQFESHEFLPGGTCTIAFDSLSMRVIKVGEDESGLGRWSYITMEGQRGRKITFITAYRICKGAMRGITTSCTQHKRVLETKDMQNGIKTGQVDTSYLRAKMTEDLLLFIQALKEAGHAVVLGIDANETLRESISNGSPKQGSISWLIEQAEMQEVFESHHQCVPDSTTTTPSRFIDRVAVFGIPIERVTLLRAHLPAKSDHLGIVVDLDLRYLFNNACSPLVSPTPRKLTSGNLQSVQKYISFIRKQFTEHKIFERCKKLREACDNDEFSEDHRRQLFSLDRQVTEILIGAENQCSKRKQYRNLWSPALKKAGQEIGYWKQRLSINGQIDDGTRDLGKALNLPETVQIPMDIPLCQFYLSVAWKTYRSVQRQSREYREKFLKNRAKEQAEKGNGDVAQAIKQIRKREQLRGDYAAIRRGYGIRKQGLSVLDIPDPITGGRTLLTQADEIHDHLLERNEKHFSQATFTPFGDAGPGFPFIDPENPASERYIEEMLDGVFEPWESASTEIREFLQELKCLVREEMNVKLHFVDFKKFFKSMSENTASSVSGLHYGHYKVLSKLEDDTILRVLFDLVDIAFLTHSPLPRWQHATQLMLEKGKGPSVENLRIIQLLEADMNWLLRYLWGKRLDRHALEAGVYNEAQFASPGKLCQSALVNKVLFFDLLRQTRQYGALTDNDATAAFDRVLPALCIVTCRQMGMPKQAQLFFFQVLRQMIYTTTTAHGRSTKTYSASANPNVPGQGVMQGGGASLANYKSQQLPVLRAFESNCIPAVFKHTSKLKSSFRRWVSGFSDDVSLFVNELGVTLSGIDSDLPMAQRVKNVVQTNLAKYEAYFFTAGGALNLRKCFYYLIGFEWTGTSWRYKTNAEIGVDPVTITPTTLTNDGTPQQLNWCEANDAQRTLGSFIAPDGSMCRQLEVLLSKLHEWQQCLRNLNSQNLRAKWLSFQTVFMKKILYPLMGHSCNADDLLPIQRIVDKEVLHILGLNEHFSRAVYHAPLKFGGLGVVSIHGQHVIEKLLLFVHHMRENRQLKETLLTSIGITQIECGMPIPFFSLPAEKWHPLVTRTWVSHIWQECQPLGIDIKFHSNCFWLPKPVRERDCCIMEIAASKYEGTQLYRINMCRLALQVTYVSDITSVDGQRILLAYYNGKPHRESGRRTRLNWPPVGRLPSTWWKLWQEFLQGWCGSALRLPNPLGRWYQDAEMLTQCCFFLCEGRLVMQHKDEFYQFMPATPRARTRFQLQAHPFTELRLLTTALVVDIVYKTSNIYVISMSAQNFVPTTSSLPTCSLQDLYRDLSPDLQRIIGQVSWPDQPDLLSIAQSVQEGTAYGVSDGSVRALVNKSTQAWIIQAPNGSEIHGYGPVDGSSDAIKSPHRAELQGHAALFLMLSLIASCFQLIGGKIRTFCDNQAVVQKMQAGWSLWRYRHTKGSDGDIQALLCTTLQHLQRTNGINYSTEWVQSHQDDMGDVRSLPRQVGLNVRMDHDTRGAYELPAEWQTRSFVPVLEAESCAVYINNAKITSDIYLSLSEQWHAKEAMEYLYSRHGITVELFSSVHWQSLRFALKKLSPHRRATAIKAIHRHLPTQEKLFKQNRVTLSSLCPRCLQTEETNSHIYCCPEEKALKQRKADWQELWRQLNKNQTASAIEQVWRYHLQPILGIPLGGSIVEGLIIARGEIADLLQVAIQEQAAIGWDKLLLGMGSNVWKTIQELTDNGNPRPPKRSATAWMNASVHQLLKFSLRCWKARNNTIHGETIKEQREIALQKARDSITAIYNNPPTLASHFRSIFEVPLEHRLRLSLQAAEHWLSLIAHQVRVTNHNFSILLRQHKPMHAHLRTMRREARSQAKERRLPATPKRAHSRAVQAAVREMRMKLYTKRSSRKRRMQNGSRQSTHVSHRGLWDFGFQSDRRQVQRPQLRQHPP